jgi:hypothetical protein
MSSLTLAALLPILKLVAGPALVWLIRTFLPKLTAALPAWAQPIAAAVVNIVVAVASGVDPVNSIAALVEAIKAAVLTLGAVKTIDLAAGKANVVTAGEKAALDRINYSV